MISDQELKDIRYASLIPHSSLFKDKVQARIQQMSAEELKQVLAGVRWQQNRKALK